MASKTALTASRKEVIIMKGACMQHWYACQAEVAPRGVPLTGHIVSGAMHLHILQLPHAHFFLRLQVQLPKYAGTVSYLYAIMV